MGKSNILMKAMVDSSNTKPIVFYDMESSVGVHQYWSAPKVRYITKLRRNLDERRWWKRFFG